MADWVELKHVMFQQSRLDRFVVKSRNPYKINARCPVCGDSKKSEVKARFWIREWPNGSFGTKCYNCGYSKPFYIFLKEQDPMGYKNYLTDRFSDDNKKVKNDIKENTPEKEIIKIETASLKGLKKISQLPLAHPARKYVLSRRIPTSKHYMIYYAPKFKKWMDKVYPGKLSDKMPEEPRLILPFFDENGKLFGFSGRSFDPKSLRYITIMFDTSKPKIFGLNMVDFSKPYKIFEGPIDSLFLDNSLAIVGADFPLSILDNLKNLENATFVYDAEPRNKEIHKLMMKLIKAGHKICVWPKDVPGKDVNLMVLNGWSTNKISKIIEENTYKGISAELQVAEWKKI